MHLELREFVTNFLKQSICSKLEGKGLHTIQAGCKESQFYSLPFEEAALKEALAQNSFQVARKYISDDQD